MENVVLSWGRADMVVNGLAMVVRSTARSLTTADALHSPIMGTCVLSILTTFGNDGVSGTHYHALGGRKMRPPRSVVVTVPSIGRRLRARSPTA